MCAPAVLWHAVTRCGLLCSLESEVRREMAAEAGGDLDIPEVDRFDSNIITPVSQQSRCSHFCWPQHALPPAPPASASAQLPTGWRFRSQGGLIRRNSGKGMQHSAYQARP